MSVRLRPMVPFSLILRKRKKILPPELKENTKFGCRMEGNFVNVKSFANKCIFVSFPT